MYEIVELPVLYKIYKQRAYSLNLEEYNYFINDLKNKINDWDVSIHLTPYDYLKHEMCSWPKKADNTDFDNILNYKKYFAVEFRCKTRIIFNNTFILFFENYRDAEDCFNNI